MNYTVSIEIALPRERVTQLLEDPAHMLKWLRGLVSHEPLRGEDGQVGTESRIVFQSGQQSIECTESQHGISASVARWSAAWSVIGPATSTTRMGSI